MIGKQWAVIRSADESLLRSLGAVDYYGRRGEELRSDGIVIYAGPNKKRLWWPLIPGADAPLPGSIR